MNAEISCIGKVQFESPQVARAIAKRANQRNDKARTAYKCEFCNGWHLGSGQTRTNRTQPKPTPKKLFSTLAGA